MDQLAEELLCSQKDLHEHGVVTSYLEDRLVDLTHDLCQDQINVLKLANLIHLCVHLRGELREGVTPADVILALHPTPAVGGLPKVDAVTAIRHAERFSRGWYAGPVGWISARNLKMAVGIRSAVCDQRKLHIFSGAGIVCESDPHAEWDEIDSKCRAILASLGVEVIS